MVRRRTAFHPLQSTGAARWHVVRNMQGLVIESRELDAGADLTRAFVASMLELIDSGWQIGEFSSTSGSFFCNRGHERRIVSIDPNNPHEVPMYGGAHLGGGPSREN